MQLNGKVLAGTTTTITTKKGTALDKTRLKVLDTGDEVAGDVSVYWIDFIGETALSEEELGLIHHEEVVIEIRRVSASGYNGKAYLNVTGGLILSKGAPVQAKLAKGKTGK
jgi:ssDNA-binding replication factor A large subunit